MKLLDKVGISIELIDVQTLMPFDIHGIIGKSIQKTNRVVFLDEDVPGGASAYMMEQVISHQDVFKYLDAPPVCITAKHHRSAYGTDGDYFCKPNAEDIFNVVYGILSESQPEEFPEIDF